MLGNISIKEAIKIVGTAGATRTKQIIQALRKIGLKPTSDKLLRIPNNWVKPGLCIVHIGFEFHWRKHWTLWNGCCFFDPAIKSRVRETFYESGRAKMLSYLEIKGKVKCVVEGLEG